MDYVPYFCTLEKCSGPAIFILLLLETGEGPGPGEPVPEQGIAVFEGTQLEGARRVYRISGVERQGLRWVGSRP